MLCSPDVNSIPSQHEFSLFACKVLTTLAPLSYPTDQIQTVGKRKKIAVEVPSEMASTVGIHLQTVMRVGLPTLAFSKSDKFQIRTINAH